MSVGTKCFVQSKQARGWGGGGTPTNFGLGCAAKVPEP